MKKNHVRRVLFQEPENSAGNLSGKINEFHAEIIERRIRRLDLSVRQKADIIDNIIQRMKSSV